MKKYVLIAGSWYYPMGGLKDVQNSFDTIEEALDKKNLYEYPKSNEGIWDWAYIIDRDTWKELYKFEPDHRKRDRDKLKAEWEKLEEEKE